MRHFRHIIIVMATCGLSACVPYNGNMRDNALTSTEEVAHFDLTHKQIAHRSKPNDIFEFTHRAHFNSKVKGIYISQNTLENREYLHYIIDCSKEAGINTFIIDLNVVTNSYEKNILLVRNSGIKFVARIAVFPFGGTPERVKSEAYWLSRYRLVDAAIKLGAEEVQLDYVCYASSQAPLATNSADIDAVISWFKQKIGNRAKLQINLFSETGSKDSLKNGQNVPTFASSIDACCPILYLSNYTPYKDQVKRPYDVIYTAVTDLKQQFNGSTPFQVYPYIEISNYRHSFSDEQLKGYIHSQIAAIEDANADGWYVWSSANRYDRLFRILKERD